MLHAKNLPKGDDQSDVKNSSPSANTMHSKVNIRKLVRFVNWIFIIEVFRQAYTLWHSTYMMIKHDKKFIHLHNKSHITNERLQ